MYIWQEVKENIWIIIGSIAGILTILECITGGFRKMTIAIMKDIRRFKKNKQYKRERSKLIEIIKTLCPLFDFNNQNSFYVMFGQIITHKLRFILLGKCFLYLKDLANYSKNYEKIIKELTVLMYYWQGIYKDIKMEEKHNEISNELWVEYRENYNNIIMQLRTFLREKTNLGIDPETFNFLTDI